MNTIDNISYKRRKGGEIEKFRNLEILKQNISWKQLSIINV